MYVGIRYAITGVHTAWPVLHCKLRLQQHAVPENPAGSRLNTAVQSQL